MTRTTAHRIAHGDLDELTLVDGLTARVTKLEADLAVTHALLLEHTGAGTVVDPGDGYYISPTGNDTTGDGSVGTPWRSIQKWIDSGPAAGATLYCRAGTYTDMITATSGHGYNVLTGTSGSPITITAYPSETPIFSGGTGPLLGLAECSYVVVDGLTMTARDIGSSGYIYTGAWGSAGYVADHITISNCTIDFSLTGQGTQEHGVYASESTEYLTIEDCLFTGPGAGNAGGYGFHAYSSATNGPRNLTVQRCIFDGWNQAGIVLWNSAITATIDHCTFVNNVIDARLEDHAAVAFSNSAFDTATGTNAIRDTYDFAYTTLTNNFFSQTFDAAYLLVAGQTGRSAATDGTDAGALDW